MIRINHCRVRGKKQISPGATNTAQTDSFQAPKVTIIADLPDSLQPKTVILDTVPRPRIVVVPKSTGSSYSITDAKGEVDKINLEPPVIKLLPVLQDAKGKVITDSAGSTFLMGSGGVSNFTTFNTDNGLALDGISCSKTDKAGNLWFGTSGGGVSRYDGKSFTTFSTAQGLANNDVRSIAEDKAGNLWFGTNGGGVSRYDGKSFVTFSLAQGLANYVVNSIAEDKAGNLWFGTGGGGVSRYDPTERSGTGLKSFTTFSTALGLADNVVQHIAEDKAGNLWFGTGGGGVSRYDGNVAPTLCNSGKCKHDLRVRQDLEEHNKQLAKSFVTFSVTQGLANNDVRSIAEDKAGNLWFGTGGGLSRYDPAERSGTASKSFTTFSTAQGLANNDVSSIVEDKAGNLWFGTSGGGVSRYDPAARSGTGSKSFTTFSTAQGLADNVVQNIAEDKAGNLWFGTNSGGVSRYDGKSFVTFSVVQGLANNNVFSIAEDKVGNLWFGTVGGGVSRYDGKSFTTFSTAQGLANNQVYSVAEDKTGNLWFGTSGGGVSRYDGKSFTTFSTAQGLANNQVFSMAEDKAGNLWFGTNGGGVSRYDGKSFTTFSNAQGLASRVVLSIAEDKTGNLWFGTYDGGGVSRYDGKSFTTFSTAQGLANNNVLIIAEDKAGNLWFGTDEGLSVMSVDEAKKLSLTPNPSPRRQGNAHATGQGGARIIKSFTKTDGLPDNNIEQIIQLPNGKIAVGTNLGIAIFRPSADFTSLTDIEIYNSNTDCPVKDVNAGQHCMLLDRKGIIWTATGSGKTPLVRFDPSAMLRSKDAPTLVLRSIKVNEESICWNDLSQKSKVESQKSAGVESSAMPAYITEEVTTFGKVLTERERDSLKRKFSSIAFDGITRFYPVPEHLVLPYKYNQIIIDFNAIETGKPNLVNYQYMLEGNDNDWSPVMKKTSATYSNIHEGSYTFKVKAQGPNGVWCEPVTFSFKVLPPWYRTWWAYAIYGILFLLTLRIFIKWRERNLQMEKEKLERTVEERTEELVQKNVVVEKQKVVLEEQKEELVQKNIVVEKQKAVVEREKQRSEELLLNILPEEVAEELKAKGTTTAKCFENVTVLFTDFVNFTQAGEYMTPQGLVDELHTCFKAFDEITGKYNIEKIKTVGDAYLAVAGLPTADPKHAENIVRAAIEISVFMQDRVAKLGNKTFGVRIGVHSGSVVAGIVGIKKFAYDIWGDTVNTAARMEQNSEPGKINISESTYELVKGKVNCEYRGVVDAKGKGKLKMYFVN